jgi:uncharacterized protein
MSNVYSYCYLHGFGSSPKSYKGLKLQELLSNSFHLECLDCNVPTFEEMTITNVLEFLEKKFEKEKKKFRFIGTSLGGLIATQFAEKFPEKVDKIILCAPAWKINELWDLIISGKETLENWEKSGKLNFKFGPQGHELDEGNFSAFETFEGGKTIGWNYYKDAMDHQYQYPISECPILIFHGTLDAQVPIKYSEEYVTLNKNAKLIQVQGGDHGLATPEILNQIQENIKTFFD